MNLNFFSDIQKYIDNKSDDLLTKDAAKKRELEHKLLQLFEELDKDFRQPRMDEHRTLYDLYRGNDKEFKDELRKFFGDEKNIYGSMEPHAIINQLHSRLLQPFYATDDLITFVPTGQQINTVKRTEALINDQITDEGFLTELDKAIKNALITGISYMTFGWKSEIKTLDKAVITVETQINPVTNKEEKIKKKTIETEEIKEEYPDFLLLRNSDILHPKVNRWQDVPYCIVIQKMSKFHFNRQFGGNTDEFIGENNNADTYDTQLDNILDWIPGTDAGYGDSAKNEVTVLHYYFADGTYIIADLQSPQPAILGRKELFTGLNVRRIAKSPVQGMPIPIIPLTLIPVAGRLEGESVINVVLQLVRLITEIRQHNVQKLREKALEPLFISKSLNLDVNLYKNREVNQIIPVETYEEDIRKFIFRPTQEPIDSAFLLNADAAKNTLSEISGVNDFFVGNLGKSSRLTGVQSLLSNALAQLAPKLKQINKFTKEVVKVLLLLNREYLPVEFIEKQVSLHQPEPVEIYEIPYPLQTKINTPVDGGGNAEVRSALLFRLLELALAMEQSKPGTLDLTGILLYAFGQGGLPEIKRFVLKSPFTEQEVTQLKQIEEIMRRFNQSGFANSENAFGIPVQPNQPAGPGVTDATGSNLQNPSPGEITGVPE